MTTTIDKLLVANRGEIAVRVFLTCRALGITTVAVFSDADANAAHVDAADQAVRVGPAPSAESYLAVESIIDAAQRTGADAIHPGYGFLAENADFADACTEAGLIFVGPPADAIRAMGSKQEAKRTVSGAGVPVVPGYLGDDQSDEAMLREAAAIGFPLLVKASAGGGGKGMRVVHDADGVQGALEGARREAAAAFGDDTLILERYVERPRHVEIQVIGDQHGTVAHLFERECSIQRRHQKIIEESPSTAVDADLRKKMGAAAVAAARAIGYTNAGTVEFILAPDGAFYFMEMNTRLQVEHPVTELVTGVDLVREQIRVAEGRTLSFAQNALRQEGSAIECRIYAEDPEHGFLPSTGRLADWHFATDVTGPGPFPARSPFDEAVLRVDSGVRRGDDVSVHYDPMLAKVVAWGVTREAAIRRMRSGLASLSVAGPHTNRVFLDKVLAHPAFAAGDTDTHFIDDHQDELDTVLAPFVVNRLAAVAVIAAFEQRRQARTLLPAVEPGYRNNRFADQTVTLRRDEHDIVVAWENLGGGRLRLTVDEKSGEYDIVSLDGDDLVLEAYGVRRRYRVVRDGNRVHVHAGIYDAAFVELPRFPEPGADIDDGGCRAPMPGKVVTVEVAEGDTVAAGDALVVLEAMKMEHTVTAPADGVVGEVRVSLGDQVDGDAVLVVIEASADE